MSKINYLKKKRIAVQDVFQTIDVVTDLDGILDIYENHECDTEFIVVHDAGWTKKTFEYKNNVLFSHNVAIMKEAYPEHKLAVIMADMYESHITVYMIPCK